MCAAAERSKRVQLIADSGILDDYGGSLDQHYAFLNVTSATADARTADVMIDPFGIYTTIWGGVDYGLQGNGIRESQEAYDIAVQMKDLLEGYGLNVIITRGEDELVEYYGENSRVAKGYEANAKYVISIGFTYGEGRSGLESYHGIQSSNASDQQHHVLSARAVWHRGLFVLYLGDERAGRVLHVQQRRGRRPSRL